MLAGWFPLVNSEGIPLEVLLGKLRDEGLVPDWPDFIEEAIRHGWNLGSLRTRIETSTGDVYGPDHRDEVIKRFDEYVRTRK